MVVALKLAPPIPNSLKVAKDMEAKTPFVKSPGFVALCAGIVLAGAGLAVSSGASHRTAMPTLYTPASSPAVSIAAERMETLPDLKALDRAFQRLADYAAPAVVSIKTEGKSDFSMTGQQQAVSGEGSGVILRPDGWIVTNDHVVAGFDKVTVILHDGREFTGTVRRAPENDIAVVKIDAKDLPTLPFSDSSQVHVGQLAMAVGAPFGLENSVTYGHVSATGRLNTIPDQRTRSVRRYFDLIQTDTAINMGNSGGPLINVDGQVIGINSAIFSLSGSSSGIGFAISSNLARTLAETLIEKGQVVRSYTGILPESLKEYEQKQLKLTSGSILRRVESNGPAAEAGLKTGDVIIRVGSLPINNEVDVRNSMFRYTPGTTVPFEIIRDGQHKVLQVKLAEPPKDNTALPPTQDDPQLLPIPKDLIPRDLIPQIPDGQPKSKDGRAHLGVQVQTVSDTLRKQYHIPADAEGAVVTLVEPNSVAAHLHLQPGDLIDSLGGQPVKSSEDLVSILSATRLGDTKSISYQRFGDGNVRTRAQIDVTFR